MDYERLYGADHLPRAIGQMATPVDAWQDAVPDAGSTPAVSTHNKTLGVMSSHLDLRLGARWAKQGNPDDDEGPGPVRTPVLRAVCTTVTRLDAP